MVKSIDTLVSDIYELLEGRSLADPQVVAKFGGNIGEVLTKRLEAKEDRQPTLRMSNLGRPLRQLVYELLGYKGEELKGGTLLKFLYGDLTEAMIICLAEAAGHKVANLQREIVVDGIVGHTDCEIDDVLFDVKSCSSFSFSKFKDGSLLQPGKDPFGYVAQLTGYKEVVKLPAAWLAFDKVHGDMCVLRLPEESRYDVQGRIKEVRETVASGTLPERCYSDVPYQKSGNTKLDTGCSYCGFRFECWKDSNDGAGLKTYVYASGPVYLTKVVKEPRVYQQTASLHSAAENDTEAFEANI